MRTIVLIGTDHNFQCGTVNKPAAIAFRALLSSICRTEAVKAIAEEMDTHGLAKYGVSETLAAGLCRELGLGSRYCDEIPGGRDSLPKYQGPLLKFDRGGSMSAQEVSEANLAMEVEFMQRAREKFWLEKIVELNTWPVIFICGADHYPYLKTLFSSNNLDVVDGPHDWSGQQIVAGCTDA